MTCSNAVLSYTSTVLARVGGHRRLACLQMIFANSSISRTILFRSWVSKVSPLMRRASGWSG